MTNYFLGLATIPALDALATILRQLWLWLFRSGPTIYGDRQPYQAAHRFQNRCRYCGRRLLMQGWRLPTVTWRGERVPLQTIHWVTHCPDARRVYDRIAAESAGQGQTAP